MVMLIVDVSPSSDLLIKMIQQIFDFSETRDAQGEVTYGTALPIWRRGRVSL